MQRNLLGTGRLADTNSILRRKTGGRRGLFSGTLTPEKAMRLAFGRAGRDVPGLEPRLESFAVARQDIAEVAGGGPDLALVFTLVRDGNVAGAAILDLSLRSVLVEAGTTGRVSAAPPEPRAPTRIDAAMCETFLGGGIALLGEISGDLSIAPTLTGWSVGHFVERPETLTLLLDERQMRVFTLGFRVAGALRGGTVTLAIPADPPRPKPAAGLASDDTFARALESVVMQSTVEVTAVLGRLSVSLAVAGEWQPGSLVEIPRELLSQVRLEDIEGEVVARGKLGQTNGMRAVRLGLPDDLPAGTGGERLAELE